MSIVRHADRLEVMEPTQPSSRGAVLAALLTLSSCTTPTIGDSGEALRPPESIDDYAWLAGTWRGTGLGGVCEETWSPPMAGAMVGTFRLAKDGENVFSEMLLLHRDEHGFALKVKHFTPGFVGWEEKEDSIRFAAESVAVDRARFAGLRMDRTGDRLSAAVRMGDEDGGSHWEPFAMQRHTR